MKISQLIHAMDRDDELIIHDYDAPIDKWLLFDGTPRGREKDDPLNKMHVESICADDDVILVLARKQRDKK